MYEKIFSLSSPADTERLGFVIGKKLQGGECIELVSDIGGGKTTFTRGLVRGIGSQDKVTSPTFTIGKQYTSKDLICYHFDFYRLNDPGLVAEELAEALADEKAIKVIEWAESVTDALPKDRIIMHLDRVRDSSDERSCRIVYSERYKKSIEGISI